MATGMSKGRTAAKAPAKKAPAKKATTTTETTKTTKSFESTDLIKCKSITNGELLVVGKRTGILYKWAEYGDIEEMEYQDLVYELRSGGNRSLVMTPYFVVLDDDFVEANPKLNEFYNSIYSIDDIEAILNLPAEEIKKTIPTLPLGVKNSLKGLAASRIDNKTLTDLNKIKALDDVFGTNMLLIVTQ